MKILFDDILQKIDAPESLISGSLADTHKYTGPLTLELGGYEKINSIGIGNTDAKQITLRTINENQETIPQPLSVIRANAKLGDKTIIAGDSSALSTDGVNWSENPIAMTARTAAASPNAVVIGGDNGAVKYSPDGVNWYDCSAPLWISEDMLCQCLHKGIQVIGCANDKILVQNDFYNWWEYNPFAASDNVMGLATNDDIIIAVLSGGEIYYSTDFERWYLANIPSTYALNACCYNGGLFIAVGDGGTILYSHDAYNFYPAMWSGTEPRDSFRAVVGYGNIFIAVGEGLVYISNDGMNWDTIDEGIGENFIGVAWGADDIIVILRDDGTVYYGNDIASLQTESCLLNNPTAIIWDGTFFTVVGKDGVSRSEHGSGWYIADSDISGNTVISDSSYKISVAGDGGNKWDSENYGEFVKYEYTTFENERITALAYIPLNGGIWAAATEHAVFYSGNDFIFRKCDIIPLPANRDMAANDGKFVLAGNGTAYSYNGLIWYIGAAITNVFTNVVWDAAQNRFIATGDNITMVSDDGINWHTIDNPPFNPVSLASTPDGVIAGDEDGSIAMLNSEVWTPITKLPIAASTMFWNDGLYIGSTALIRLEKSTGTVGTINFEGNGLYMLDREITANQLIISCDGSYIGRIAVGRAVNIPTSIPKEPALVSTNKPRVTLSGQVIDGLGGYDYWRISVDSRYKIDKEKLREIINGYPALSKGIPLFILFDTERKRLPFLRMYANDTSQQQLSFESSINKPLFSRRWIFEERF